MGESLRYTVEDQVRLVVEAYEAARDAGMVVEAEAVCRRMYVERGEGSHAVVARARCIRRLRRLVRLAYGLEG